MAPLLYPLSALDLTALYLHLQIIPEFSTLFPLFRPRVLPLSTLFRMPCSPLLQLFLFLTQRYLLNLEVTLLFLHLHTMLIQAYGDHQHIPCTRTLSLALDRQSPYPGHFRHLQRLPLRH